VYKRQDIITIDALTGQLTVDAELAGREADIGSNRPDQSGFARPLFAGLRRGAHSAEQGGGLSILEHLS